MVRRVLLRLNTRCLMVILGIVLCFLWIVLNSKDIQIASQDAQSSTLTKDILPPADGLRNTCTITNMEEIEAFFGEIQSDMSTWTFKNHVDCHKHDIGETFTFRRRRRMSVQCTKGFVHVAYTETTNSSDVYTLNEKNDTCFKTFLQTCCGSDHRVPNVVHYVWYLRGTLKFTSFVSILSVVRFIKPCAIIFHGEIPFGRYWDAITYFYPNFIHFKRERPTRIFRFEITIPAHSSDIMRIEALTKYGGIYLDMDTVMVKPVDQLMDYSFVMSNQTSGYFGSAFLMSEPNAKFLQLWLNKYRSDYRSDRYIYNAMVVPMKLAEKEENKHLIHVEYGTISRPHHMSRTKIFSNKYATHDWSDMYGIHTFIRIYKGIVNETTIRNMNNTFGSVCRHVFYGNKELCV